LSKGGGFLVLNKFGKRQAFLATDGLRSFMILPVKLPAAVCLGAEVRRHTGMAKSFERVEALTGF
jgi:hypothetical protein